MFKGLWSLLVALPQLLELINNIKEANQERATKAKVKADIEVINQAFKDKDAQKLNDLFNS